MRIIFLPEIRDYFRELAQILFDKDYFGFEESALRYLRQNNYVISQNNYRLYKNNCILHQNDGQSYRCAVLQLFYA
jgi:hypothetical protein